MSGAVLWAETPNEDGDEQPDSEARGEVDESFAARRLRRWLKGMFGGKPVEGDTGEPGGSPAEK